MRVCPQCLTIYAGDAERCGIDGVSLVVQERDPLVGNDLGSFTVEERLGFCRVGTLYRAKTRGKEQIIASLYGEYASNAYLMAQLDRQQQENEPLDHPAYLSPVGFAELEQGLRVLFFDASPTTTVKDGIEDNGPFGAVQTARSGHLLASALMAAHEMGAIHGDILPHTILYHETRSGPEIKAIDFRIAHLLDEIAEPSWTRNAWTQRPAAYIAPELADGSLGPSVDLYALGVLMYQMLTGELPVVDKARLLRERLSSDLQSWALEALETYVLRLLANDPSERPETAQQVTERLRELSGALVLCDLDLPTDDIRNSWAEVEAPYEILDVVDVQEERSQPPGDEEEEGWSSVVIWEQETAQMPVPNLAQEAAPTPPAYVNTPNVSIPGEETAPSRMIPPIPSPSPESRPFYPALDGAEAVDADDIVNEEQEIIRSETEVLETPSAVPDNDSTLPVFEEDILDEEALAATVATNEPAPARAPNPQPAPNVSWPMPQQLNATEVAPLPKRPEPEKKPEEPKQETLPPSVAWPMPQQLNTTEVAPLPKRSEEEKEELPVPEPAKAAEPEQEEAPKPIRADPTTLAEAIEEELEQKGNGKADEGWEEARAPKTTPVPQELQEEKWKLPAEPAQSQPSAKAVPSEVPKPEKQEIGEAAVSDEFGEAKTEVKPSPKRETKPTEEKKAPVVMGASPKTDDLPKDASEDLSNDRKRDEKKPFNPMRIGAVLVVVAALFVGAFVLPGMLQSSPEKNPPALAARDEPKKADEPKIADKPEITKKAVTKPSPKRTRKAPAKRTVKRKPATKEDPAGLLAAFDQEFGTKSKPTRSELKIEKPVEKVPVAKKPVTKKRPKKKPVVKKPVTKKPPKKTVRKPTKKKVEKKKPDPPPTKPVVRNRPPSRLEKELKSVVAKRGLAMADIRSHSSTRGLYKIWQGLLDKNREREADRALRDLLRTVKSIEISPRLIGAKLMKVQKRLQQLEKKKRTDKKKIATYKKQAEDLKKSMIGANPQKREQLMGRATKLLRQVRSLK